ncbi:uncharacterized protein TRAVEDRAFT_113015, partial [Trametes versicolor FP-101664 SS1]|uniref:uncharacterized protein n=1 Tax=Trametes versicolor (strain FP-101664) TaxID=717944 RepID=UPI00046245E1
ERLSTDWVANVYGFYHPVPEIAYVGARCSHLFHCKAKGCKYVCCRFLDKGDASSTSNLRRHVRKCWGADILKAADKAANIAEVNEKIVGSLLKDGSITSTFKRKKGVVTYSHRTHTRTETRYSLMKTGRPGYWLPSPSTITRDIKFLFGKTHERLAQILQDYEGRLSFATDAWTSPNHRAFVAVTIHFVYNDNPISLLLDLVEVPEVRTALF